MIALVLSIALAQHADSEHPPEQGPEMAHITHHLDEAEAAIDDISAKIDALIALEESEAVEVGPEQPAESTEESSETDTGALVPMPTADGESG